MQRDYQLGNMKYIVNSIFSIDSNRTLDDNLKYLISKDINKAS